MSDQKRLPRSYSAADVMSMRYSTLPFQGVWYDTLGNPERTGRWFVFGHSGNGKTSFVFQLMKELTKYGRVLMVSKEEGVRKSIQEAIKRHQLDAVKPKNLFQIVEDSPEVLADRLRRKQSAHFVIIDSIQEMGFKYKRVYEDFCREFKDKKLIVFISQIGADGQPIGAIGTKAHYDADIKIFVEGNMAIYKGRIPSPGKDFCIYPKGAAELLSVGLEVVTNDQSKE